MLVYRCGRLLGTFPPRSLRGRGGALCLTFTSGSTRSIAEVYTANAFFLVATVNLLLEWANRGHWGWLAGAGVALAIGLTNHLVLATLAPAAIAFVVATRGRAPSDAADCWWAWELWRRAWWSSPLPGRRFSVRRFWKLWYGPPGIWEYMGLDFAPGPSVREGRLLPGVFESTSSRPFRAGSAWPVLSALLRNRPAAALLLLADDGVECRNVHAGTRSGRAPAARNTCSTLPTTSFSPFCVPPAPTTSCDVSRTRKARRDDGSWDVRSSRWWRSSRPCCTPSCRRL